MIAGTFFDLVAWLYYVCFVLSAGLSLFIVVIGGNRTRPALRWTFFLLAISLVFWQFTLFLEVRSSVPDAVLWLGRANFASVLFAVYFAFRFIQEIPVKASHQTPTAWLLGETGVLAAITLFTPFVSMAERVEAGQAITTFGPLFLVYILHILGYLVAALVLALRKRNQAKDHLVRGQLTLVSIGMLTTGSIGFLTNVLFAYGFRDFRFDNVGTLSTFVFLLAVAYAAFIYHLFDLRIIVRGALVYGVLLAFVLGGYGATVFLVTQYLTDGAGKLTQFVVLLIAFSFDPLRRFLQQKTDHLLFGSHREKEIDRKQLDNSEGREKLRR